MKKFFAIIAALFILTGCAGAPTYDADRDYAESVARINYDNCKAAYQGNRWMFYDYADPDKLRYHDIRRALITNDCQRVLGPQWVSK